MNKHVKRLVVLVFAVIGLIDVLSTIVPAIVDIVNDVQYRQDLYDQLTYGKPESVKELERSREQRAKLNELLNR